MPGKFFSRLQKMDKHTVISCLLWMSWLCSGEVLAEACRSTVAVAVSVQGMIESRSTGSKLWKTVRQNDNLCAGDLVRVRVSSRAGLYLNNGTVLRLGELSSIRFPEDAEKSTTWLELIEGIAHFLSRVKHSFEIDTPYLNAFINGTEFTVQVDKQSTQVSVMEGAVLARNDHGSIEITNGQSVRALAGQAPVLQLMVHPRDAVQWALYYPPVLYFSGAEIPDQLGRSMAAYSRSDLVQAFALLNQVDNKHRSVQFYTYRATLNLSVGRIESARADIDQALKMRAGNADALALKSVIATVQNENDTALTLAQQAIEANPRAAGPRIAQSYALQARFDLEQARDAAMTASKLEPTNALAWVRLAEIWASLDDRDKALEAADRAVQLNPELSRTQTILGFSYLIRLDISNAESAFHRAIELDSADPVARLGLGLAMIRQGKLKDGRHEMEIAVDLDPLYALLRSYLGKAYLEEGRTDESGVQLALAKQLDPRDPTAWLYEAIRKQSINRPIEALGELDKSIALNDNRAVFRSRLLLQQDQAARGANLGRIYADLGFDQLATTEGWKATTLDPSNSSAHELLADAYSRRSRHEIARVSEILQANMLQPLSVFPLHALSFGSESMLQDNYLPANLSSGEYSELFNQNGMGGRINAFLGSNATRGDRISAFGLTDRVSLLANQYHYQTDGFRDNNDLTVDVYNLIGQVFLSDRNLLQLEMQREKRENGDLDLLFDLDIFSPDNREKRTDSFFRIGHRYDLTPRTTLLTSLFYLNTDFEEKINEENPTPFGPVTRTETEDENTDAYLAEFQVLSRGTRQQWMAGIGYFDKDSEGDGTRSYSAPPSFPFPFLLPSPEPLTSESQTKHANGYLYFYSSLGEIQLVSGLSYDTYDSRSTQGQIEKSQFNPKLGMIWQPDNALTFRIAGFRTLMGSTESNRSLQPTHIAGFNQFYDDVAGSDTKRIGAGLDYRFSSGHTIGAEISGRSLKVPFRNGSTEEEDERAFRGYYYKTLGSRWSAALDVEVDKFERSPPLDEVRRPNELRTTRIPFKLNYHHPNGIYGNLGTTHVRQKVNGLVVNGEASERFWTVDGKIGYRLPNRLGSIEAEVRNLFDEDFNYFENDFQTGAIPRLDFIPERTITISASINL